MRGRPNKLLLNPKRFMIATVLYMRGPSTMAELQRILGLSWGDLDSNIRRMRSEGYVETRKIIKSEGPRTLVYLTNKGLKAFTELLDYLEEVLRSLGRLSHGKESNRR